MTPGLTKLIQNCIALFFSRLSPRIFSFLFVIYIARFLGAEDFGKFVLALGYFELFLALSARALTIIATREIAKLPSKADEYISLSVILGLMLTVVTSSLLVALCHIFPYSQDTRSALYLVCIALLPSTIAAIFEGAFVGFQKAEYVTYGTVIENCLRTALWFIALILGYRLLVLITILVATRGIVLLFYLFYYSRTISRFKWSIDLKGCRTFINEWRVIAFENWLSTIIYGLDIILISILCGESMVGIYSAANKVVNFADIAASSFVVAVFPYMCSLYKESETEFMRLIEGSLKFMLVILIPGTIVLFTLSDKVIWLIYGKEFIKSAPILSVLVWLVILKFLNPFLSHVLFAKGEQRRSLQAAAISLICYMPIGALFVRWWGGVGGAWALLIVATLTFCLLWNFVWRKHRASHALLIFARVAIASAVFGITLFLLRRVPISLSLIPSCILYLVMMVIFNVFSSAEIQTARVFLLKIAYVMRKRTNLLFQDRL